MIKARKVKELKTKCQNANKTGACVHIKNTSSIYLYQTLKSYHRTIKFTTEISKDSVLVI